MCTFWGSRCEGAYNLGIFVCIFSPYLIIITTIIIIIYMNLFLLPLARHMGSAPATAVWLLHSSAGRMLALLGAQSRFPGLLGVWVLDVCIFEDFGVFGNLYVAGVVERESGIKGDIPCSDAFGSWVEVDFDF